ncbi:hypothetical protein RYX36_020987 [Vicia faba]
MLSAVIRSALGYPAFTVGTITGTPESNFYPLSDGPSTRHRRITKADFRPCSTGGSCSQAPFCLCTRGPISVWPEETFARLRYLLGGLRPIETVYLRLSLGLSWDKVVRIFTDMSISSSLSPRQCPDRYAFRAGRNLPDKEFRYLRTFIVTAAVHRGFGRRLPCHQVTNFLNLPALGRHVSVRQVVSCLLVNSAAVRKVDLFGNPRIFDSLQLPEAFHRIENE